MNWPRRRRLLWTGAAAVALTVLLFSGNAVLPELLSRLIAAQLAGRTVAGNVTVELKAYPGWRLLTGRAAYLHLDLREARFGPLPVDSFLLDAYDVQLDPKRLWRKGEIVVQRHGPLQATLRLTEANVNEYLWTTVDKDRTFRLTLGEGTATAEGSLPLLGQRVPLRLKGRFRLEPPLTLRYVPEQFFLASLPVPRALLEGVVAKLLVLQIRVEDLPVRVRLTNVRVEPGRAFLFASGEP